MELRRRAEESDRKAIASNEAEGALKVTGGTQSNQAGARGKRKYHIYFRPRL